MRFETIFIFVSIFFYQNIYSQTLAFPGAEGFGAYAKGGRGGDVYTVINLHDSGKGSFRYGIKSAKGPRTIVFAISGIIRLKSTLRVNKDFITIAGQTAPGDGICLRDANLSIEASHIIIRYIRSRLGHQRRIQDDAISIRSGKNIIIDHCSASWSVDETLSCQSSTVDLITVQWCMITESLRNSVHEKGPHGYGGIIGSKRQTFHHNLYAHHTSRSPKVTGRRHCEVDFRNNVIYNWGYNNCYDGTSSYMNWVNNYYKAGPATANKVKNQIFGLSDAPIKSEGSNSPEDSNKYETTLYIKGNYMDGFPEVIKDNWQGVNYKNGANEKDHKGEAPFKGTPILNSETSAEQAFSLVIANAGASKSRDKIDERIIHEVKTGTTTFGNFGIIDDENEVGGWPAYQTMAAPKDRDQDGMPDQWEILNNLNPNDAGDRNDDSNKNGFTNLEEYLHFLVSDNE